MKTKIGTNIKKLRIENSFTQERLAELVGVSTKLVSKWECGIYNPDLYSFVMLVEKLNTSYEELLDEVDVSTLNKRKYKTEK